MPHPTRRAFLATAAGTLAGATFSLADTPLALTTLSLKQASAGIESRKFSPVDLTEAALDSARTLNPKTNAWIAILREKALAQAKTLADEQAAGKLRGPLHGIPVGIKDSIDTQGTRTTGASAVYEYRFPSEDAEVVRRLKAAGAIILGKNNMHEFDAGASSAVSYWGPVRNPWEPGHIAGGPSGGSAAAVATANCFAALGTDSGGGLRIPAAHCGVTGFKPTHGRVSLRGIIPFAWSLDHCGPLARSAEDAALLLQQIAGYDPLDIDSLDHPVPDFLAAIGAPVQSFRIGLAPQFFDHLDDEIARAFEDALKVLEKLTKGAYEVGLPGLLHAGVAAAEIAAYHETVRGVNGGGFEPSTGRIFPAQDSTRAVDYIKGWRELTLIRRTIDAEVFRKQNFDVLLAPVTRHLPGTIEDDLVPGGSGAGSGGGGGGRGGGRGVTPAAAPAAGPARTGGDPEENTKPFNYYGLPTISIPCGFSKDGLPIGLQIAATLFNEAAVLSLAHAYQQATDWHTRRPVLTSDTKVPALSKAASEQTGN